MKTETLAVRLQVDQKQKLERFAEKVGLTPSDLIRAAVTALLEEPETLKGKITLPLRVSFTA